MNNKLCMKSATLSILWTWNILLIYKCKIIYCTYKHGEGNNIRKVIFTLQVQYYYSTINIHDTDVLGE